MKIKNILSLVATFQLALSICAQEQFIYSAQGERVFFEKEPRSVITILEETCSVTQDSIFNTIKKKDTSAKRLSKNLILTKLENALISVALEKCPCKIHISPLLTRDGQKFWSSNRIFVKPIPDVKIEQLIALIPDDLPIFIGFGSDSSVYFLELENSNAISLSNKLYESGLVVFAQPDFGTILQVNSDMTFEYQWNLHNDNINNHINILGAWDITQGQGTKVAVIDLGVELTHPILINSLTLGYDATDGLYGGAQGGCRTIDQHGTNCAGIIAADNGYEDGFRGVAYKSKIIPIRTAYTSDTEGLISYISWIADGIFHAWHELGADVLSNSWELRREYAEIVYIELTNALSLGRNSKGCVVVFSSGNKEFKTISGINLIPGIINVGATGFDGKRHCYGSGSDWGSTFGTGLSVMAPGVNVPTTTIYGSYGYFSGTSAACPHVSGLASLLISANPNLTTFEVGNIIKSTSQKVHANYYHYNLDNNSSYGAWSNEMGYGLVDAYQAVLLAANPPAHPDLWLRDNMADNGCEPNETSTDYSASPDIWLTNQYNELVTEPAVGQTYNVHVRISNRSLDASTAATLTLSFGISKTGFNSNNGRLSCPRICNQVATGFVVSGYPLGTLAAGATTEFCFQWTVPNPSTDVCQINIGDPWQVAIMACIDDDNTTPGISGGIIPADQQARLSNNVAYHGFPLEFNGLSVIIDEPLIPILGAPTTLTGGSSEADAELIWLACDGRVLGTGETLAITPSATTERYVLEGYSPSLNAYATDTLVLHPRPGSILAVSPNPVVGGQTEVSCCLATTLSEATLQLVGSLGQAVLNQPITPASDGKAHCTLNLQSVQSGHYQLRLMSAGTLIDTHSIVVQ